jgi:hypothetical protein
MKKFTFKTEKPTGRYKSFYNVTHHVKYNKVEIGTIDDKTFKIRLRVIKQNILEDGNPNCSWKWITLKKESASINEAKQFLNDNIAKITSFYSLPSLS